MLLLGPAGVAFSVMFPSERGRSVAVPLFPAMSNQSRSSDSNKPSVNRSLALRDRSAGWDDGRLLPASFPSSNLPQICQFLNSLRL